MHTVSLSNHINCTMKKFIFSLFIFVIFFGSIELFLRSIDFEGSSTADIVETAGFHENAYVHRRDRTLGNWYLKTSDGYESNPKLIERGFHREHFLTNERRIFSIGGSTTYGSPFEHKEKGFSGRLQKTLQNIRFINAGVAGMDSAALPAMSTQLSAIGGTGVIMYTGNNELRGALLRACSTQNGLPFQQLYVYRWLQDQYRQWSGIQYTYNQLAEHQEDCMQRALKQSINQHPTQKGEGRSDPFYLEILQQFQNNIMLAITSFGKKNMHVWLIIPPINLNSPPQQSRIDPTLPEHERKTIHQLIQKKEWNGVLQRDPKHARANFSVGIDKQDTKKLLLAAEHDYASSRITPSLQNILVGICTNKEPHVTCIDLRYLQNDNIEQYFHDFCHPTYEYGVDLIAQSLLPHIQPHVP